MARGGVILVGCLLVAGCGNGGDGTQDLVLSSDVAHELTLRGTAALADGTPLSNSPVSFKLVASGVNLFGQEAGRCQTDLHMQGGATSTTRTDEKGAYSLSINMAGFVSAASAACTMQKTLGQLSELEIEASVAASPELCSSYCAAATAAPDCAATCASGRRRIATSHKLAQAQLAELDRASNQGSATAALDFRLVALGPSLSSRHGADLTVDAAAAETSAHVTTEVFAAGDCAVVEGCLSGPGTRRLLRFDGVIRNLGDQDFTLGNPDGNPLFVFSACHNHYHLRDVMLYELLYPGTREPVVIGGAKVVGRKQGFCMEDIDPVAGDEVEKFDCDTQGITAGWADVYDGTLDCQWIDVTGVPAGDYILRLTVNPSGSYPETDMTNNSAEARVRIPE